MPAAREDGRLDADLARMSLVRTATDPGVLALGVLAHEEHVDVARPAAGERAGHALQQPHRPHVGPEVEALPDLEDQAPERDVVGDVGPADGAHQDRVDRPELLDRIGGHHRAVLQPVIRAPVELAPFDLERELVEAEARLRDDLGADAVARQQCDAVCHCRDPSERGTGRVERRPVAPTGELPQEELLVRKPSENPMFRPQAFSLVLCSRAFVGSSFKPHKRQGPAAPNHSG